MHQHCQPIVADTLVQQLTITLTWNPNFLYFCTKIRFSQMEINILQHTHTHTLPFNGPFSGTTQVSRYQKGKTNLDVAEARDSEWQWRQLGRMQVCTLLQTDNHASTPPLSFLQAGCPSCRPTNSVKALKAKNILQMTSNSENVSGFLCLEFQQCQ